MGMIFVPSREGVQPLRGDEYASDEQCAQGTEVLLRSMLDLDRKLP